MAQSDYSNTIFKYLTLDNDGSTYNANVNGSVTPQKFQYSHATKNLLAHRIIIYIRDAGVFQAQKFGFLNELSNGMGFAVTDASDVIQLDLCDGVTITNNAGFARLCYDVTHIDWGAGDEALAVRWTFAKAGQPLLIPATYHLQVTVNDDLTGLIEHTYMLQGVYS